MSAELERAAAGCLLPGFEGLSPPGWLLERLEAGLGGVCLFSRNVREPGRVAALTEAIHAAGPQAVVSIDEEGGDVTRLELAGGSSYPGSHALGAVDDVGLTERVAAALGADLAAAGIDLDLAPVADVNTNPRNPVIGIRAFGSEPALVARHVAAFVTGLQRAGVAACAKHFPGHGDTHVDSHLELPTVDVDRVGLEPALHPFRTAIAAGVRSIMTAHIRVPALDDAPATLSRPVLTGLLRDELGFRGAVLTDALEMRAISAAVGVGEAAVRSLAAGADGLLLGHDLGEDAVAECLDAVLDAVRTGALPEQRVAEAAGRVSALRAREGGAVAADRAAGAEAARRALAADGAVRLTRPALVVELSPRPGIAAGPAEHGLGEALRARAGGTEVVTVGEGGELPAANGARQLVLVLRDAHRHEWQRRAAEALLAGAADAVAVETGIPEWRPAGAGGYVATHGAGRVNLEAAVERLLTG